MKLTHIRHLAAIVVAAQLAMSASAAPIDNYIDLANAVASAVTGDTLSGPQISPSSQRTSRL